MSSPRIVVGIPTYNGGRDLLPWCLRAIRQRSATGLAYDLVVIDDSGRGEHREVSSEVAEKWGAKWTVHGDGRNHGITASWNALAHEADSDSIVVLLNDDIIVSPGWLDALVYFLTENPGAGVAGLGFYFITREDVSELLRSPEARVTPRHHQTKKPLAIDEYVGRGTERPGRVMCAPGCAFAFWKRNFDLVGGFDAEMVQFYNESDFGTALAAKGLPSYVIPHPILWHIWSATFGRAPELLKGDPMARDRAAYVKKWGGDFDVTDPRFMKPIHARQQEVKWIATSGPKCETY